MNISILLPMTALSVWLQLLLNSHSYWVAKMSVTVLAAYWGSACAQQRLAFKVCKRHLETATQKPWQTLWGIRQDISWHRQKCPEALEILQLGTCYRQCLFLGKPLFLQGVLIDFNWKRCRTSTTEYPLWICPSWWQQQYVVCRSPIFTTHKTVEYNLKIILYVYVFVWIFWFSRRFPSPHKFDKTLPGQVKTVSNEGASMNKDWSGRNTSFFVLQTTYVNVALWRFPRTVSVAAAAISSEWFSFKVSLDMKQH